MTLDAIIEAVLFYKAEPVSIQTLATICAVTDDAVREALALLNARLKGRGVQLLLKDEEALLTTAPEASDAIAELAQEELERDLSKAALETLTIILYRSPVSRAEIDYIRGVNSQFTLRSLAMRGLIERIPGEERIRVALYQPTFSLLGHLGIKFLFKRKFSIFFTRNRIYYLKPDIMPSIFVFLPRISQTDD